MHVNQPGRFGRTSRNRFDLHQRAACSIGFRTVVLMLDRAMLQRAPLLGFQAVHLPRPCLVILNRDEIKHLAPILGVVLVNFLPGQCRFFYCIPDLFTVLRQVCSGAQYRHRTRQRVCLKRTALGHLAVSPDVKFPRFCRDVLRFSEGISTRVILYPTVLIGDRISRRETCKWIYRPSRASTLEITSGK